MLEHEECYHIDDFEYDEENQQGNQNEYAGFLHVERTYGKRGKRYLYKVVPYNRELPQLLIPYDVKIEFSKNMKNKYILFEYDDSNNSLRTGKLLRTLGDSDDLNAYYQYLLYGKNVKPNISKMNKYLKTYPICSEFCEKIFNKFPQNSEYIISIDNPNSEYFDDALSINDDILTVYISNVCTWLEELSLWEYMNDELKTIYLPNHRELMLSKSLTELCSLHKNKKSLAICIHINNNLEYSITFETIQVNNNFFFGESNLHSNEQYIKMVDFTNRFTTIYNSEQLVSYWMVFVNTKIGELLSKSNKGIFKKNIQKYDENELIKMLLDKSFPKDYYLLEGDYCQITSPIRRKADILNILLIMCQNDFTMPLGEHYLNSWLKNIKKYNQNMKFIRNIENEAILIDKIILLNNKELIYNGKMYGDYIKVDTLNKIIKYHTNNSTNIYNNSDVKLIIKIIECDEKKRIRIEIL
jgi:hypothetical protein